MRYNHPEDIEETLHQMGYKISPGHALDSVRFSYIDSALLDLYKKGWSMREMASILDTTHYFIWSHLHDLQTETRPKGGPNNLKHGRFAGKEAR